MIHADSGQPTAGVNGFFTVLRLFAILSKDTSGLRFASNTPS
jgi:hypothetical protein